MAPRYVALAPLTVGLVFTTSPVAARSTEARPTASHSRGAAAPVVPLTVQRLLKKRVPAAAYAPTRLPAGYRYVKYENINRTGFDLYFGCCRKYLPLLAFDAVLVRRDQRCSQGPPSPRRAFRIAGVLVHWDTRLYSRWAWRCITQGRRRLLVTVSDGQRHTPRELAWMVAWVRPIR